MLDYVMPCKYENYYLRVVLAAVSVFLAQPELYLNIKAYRTQIPSVHAHIGYQIAACSSHLTVFVVLVVLRTCLKKLYNKIHLLVCCTLNLPLTQFKHVQGIEKLNTLQPYIEGNSIRKLLFVSLASH